MVKVSKNQLRRYPLYLKYFKKLKEEGVTHVVSPLIASYLGTSEEQARKDLQAICPKKGTPRKGRLLSETIKAIEDFLGYNGQTEVVLIGVGVLAQALCQHGGFADMGIRLTAAIDPTNESKESHLNGLPVCAFSALKKLVNENDIKIAILAVKPELAQEATDKAISAGIKGLWNFTSASLDVPSTIAVEDIGFASSFAVLSHQVISFNGKK